MKLTQKLIDEADEIVDVHSIEEIAEHFTNMLLALATAMCRVQGWYGFHYAEGPKAGKKVLVRLVS